jgi:general secretion pathway protein F
MYPIIVCGVSIIIVFFLLGYVVPQVANVFAGTHHELPILTRIMLALGNAIKEHFMGILLAVFLIIVGGSLLWRKPKFRDKFDAFILTVPIIGKLAMSYNSAQFASTLSMLCAAGVPILRAIQASADTLSNRAMRLDALDIVVLVREGAPLGSALVQKKRFVGLVAMFARLGEQTGQLPKMLERAAAQISNEVQRKAMNLATIMEPLLIVAMGLIVMLIVLAVMMPILDLNNLVSQ